MSFAEPARLWALSLPALLALGVLLRHRIRLRQQRRLASPAVWARLMGGVPATGLWRMLAWCLAAALVIVALAYPQWGQSPAEESVRTRDLVVAIDVSDSMLCPDVRPTRLGRSLEMVQRVLPALEGNRMGVVVFAGEAYPLVPLTTDLHAVGTFLAAVEPGMVARPGSDLERAVTASLELLPEEGEGRVVVVVSDGENLQGDLAAAGDALREAGVGVLAVVAGTEAGGPIPVVGDDGAMRYKRDSGGQPVVTRARRDVLAGLAEAVAGELVDLVRADAGAELVTAVERLRTREIEATRSVHRIDRFQIFLVAAAAFLAVGFLLSPWRRAAATAAVLLLVAGSPVGAQQVGVDAQPPAAAPGSAAGQTEGSGVRVSWWQRLIPGGSRRLARSGGMSWRKGKVEQAAEDFAQAVALDPESPERLYDIGTALAALGQLQLAGPALQRAHEEGIVGAAYNSGTASLLNQDAQSAVQQLRQALLRSPADPEVKRNYELALRLLEQQQQEQQQQQQEQEQENEEQPQPTPTPSPGDGPPPTPTPDPNSGLFAALERAEAEAREAMQTPTPQAARVEKDW